MKRKIDINNYFEHTKTEFKFIKEFDRNQIVKTTKKICKPISIRKMIQLIANALNIDKKELKLNYESFNNIYRTGSFYFEWKNKILRLSDHWSDANNEKVNKVFNIRTCYWTLKVNKKDNKNVIGKNANSWFYNYQLAVCSLNKFKNYSWEEYYGEK